MAAININQNNFNEIIHSGKKVLLDFWAPWCGPCRMVVPMVEEIAEERPDILVGKINVDEEPELASRYRVISIPTLLVMKDGQVVHQAVGARPKNQILDLKKENDNLISICMGSTSADIENRNTPMLKKYPIIAVNGCKNNCVNTILENKGVDVFKTINAADVLENYSVSANDPFRLDDEAEECVKIIKKELTNTINSYTIYFRTISDVKSEYTFLSRCYK